MSKTTITRLFIGSLAAVIVGAIVGFATVWLAIANDVFITAGQDVIGIRGSALAWSLLGIGIASILAVTAGLIGGFVSWFGILRNTWRLASKAWFIAMLLLGIFNLGFVAMIAYLVAGPDGTASETLSPATAPLGA
jgi:MFS family permease